MDKDIQKEILFAIPVYSKVMPKYFEKRSAILKRIAAHVKDDGNRAQGLKCCPQLHLDDETNIAWLMKRLANISAGCIHEHNPDFLVNHEVHLLSSWVNILPGETWSSPQTHSQFDWSGIFYAHVDSPKKGDSGLIFINPFPHKQKWARQVEVSFEAKEGMVIIFPSHLTHLFVPHQDKQPRISIAFNLKIVPSSPTPSIIGEVDKL